MLLVSIVAIVHPVHEPIYGHDPPILVAVGIPGTVAVLYPLLALVFLTGARVLARAVNDHRLPLLRARGVGVAC